MKKELFSRTPPDLFSIITPRNKKISVYKRTKKKKVEFIHRETSSQDLRLKIKIDQNDNSR